MANADPSSRHAGGGGAEPCERRSACPINYALEIFGDKWTLLILRDLMFKGKDRYGDFQASAEGVSTNILADRLKRLEWHGLVSRSTGESKPSQARPKYLLTRKGQDLLRVMLEITRWSGKYDPDTNADPAVLAALEQDLEGLVARIEAGWQVATGARSGDP